MDLTISIVDGHLHTTLYEKPQNLYLYLPPHSSHPRGIEAGLIYGQVRCSRRCSNKADSDTCIKRLFQQLVACGHTPERLIPIFIQAENNVASCNLETQEIILHYISKFEQEELLMVGSANSVSEIDEEILAPGRFDVMIPVFPPNLAERSEIILYAMTKNLESDSLLFKILKNNKADKIPFWHGISSQMKVFSNTMLIDFTQSLKKRIKNLYQKTRNEHLKIDQNLLKAALRDAAGPAREANCADGGGQQT